MVSSTPRAFLGLKWKIFIFSTLVLLSVVVLYSIMALHYHQVQLHALFESNAVQSHQRLTGLVQQSAHRLQRLASQVATDTDLLKKVKRRQYGAIKSSFLKTVDQTKTTYDVRSISLVDSNLQQKVAVGPQLPEDWLIKQTLMMGDSQTAVYCQTHCGIYVTQLIVVSDSVNWVLMMSVSLDHLIDDYGMIFGSDVALLQLEEQNQRVRSIMPWRANLLEATDFDKVMGVLLQLSLVYQWQHVQEGVLHTENQSVTQPLGQSLNQQQYFWVQSIPMLGTLHNPESMQLVFIENVTDLIMSYRVMMKKDIYWSVAIWFLVQPLFVLGLWRPIGRLQRLVEELPKATPEFQQSLQISPYRQLAQLKIAHLEKNWKQARLFRDESDALISVVCQFLNRMQETERQLIKRSELLDTQRGELEKERDFITCLLDHAHALILTQTSRAAIKMVNRHGVLLTGREETDVIGQSFISLLNYSEELPDIRFQLDELAKGIKNEFSHETEFVRYDGKQVYMVWHHARLPEKDEYGYEVLTVALDISQRKHAEEYLSWLAAHDALTGLINRRKFTDDLERLLKSSMRYGHRGALLLFDLDQFKDVNDSSGHHVGDDLLKRVSRSLRKQSRDTDIVARLGGDEFAMIVLEADEVEAGETAERMCRSLNRIQVAGDNTSHKVSASIGVAIFPKHGSTVEELQANANLAMIQAKESGRNGWRLFQDGDQTWSLIHERVYWNEMVKRVLEAGDFPIYYQPIMDLRTKEISHYEALMRIFNHKGDALSTQKFFLSAEHSGTIQEIDLKIMRRVFEQKKYLESAGIRTKLSVNLSGMSFKNPQLLSYVTQLVTDLAIEPKEVIFEITETAAVSDAKGTRHVMDAIKKLGCKFALDDFGVGFSSLYYLKQFPFDYVKIDGSFIRNITEDMDDQVMVKALVEVAQSFGQYTVAEFVETDETIDLLHYLNVDYAQGYRVGRPAPPEDLWPEAYQPDTQATALLLR